MKSGNSLGDIHFSIHYQFSSNSLPREFTCTVVGANSKFDSRSIRYG